MKVIIAETNKVITRYHTLAVVFTWVRIARFCNRNNTAKSVLFSIFWLHQKLFRKKVTLFNI